MIHDKVKAAGLGGLATTVVLWFVAGVGDEVSAHAALGALVTAAVSTLAGYMKRERHGPTALGGAPRE